MLVEETFLPIPQNIIITVRTALESSFILNFGGASKSDILHIIGMEMLSNNIPINNTSVGYKCCQKGKCLFPSWSRSALCHRSACEIGKTHTFWVRLFHVQWNQTAEIQVIKTNLRLLARRDIRILWRWYEIKKLKAGLLRLGAAWNQKVAVWVQKQRCWKLHKRVLFQIECSQWALPGLLPQKQPQERGVGYACWLRDQESTNSRESQECQVSFSWWSGKHSILALGNKRGSAHHHSK